MEHYVWIFFVAVAFGYIASVDKRVKELERKWLAQGGGKS